MYLVTHVLRIRFEICIHLPTLPRVESFPKMTSNLTGCCFVSVAPSQSDSSSPSASLFSPPWYHLFLKTKLRSKIQSGSPKTVSSGNDLQSLFPKCSPLASETCALQNCHSSLCPLKRASSSSSCLQLEHRLESAA